MSVQRIGILHPGEMGMAVAATAKNSGHRVYWASEGRSLRTRARAESAGLTDTGTVARLCETCPVIASVRPPEFAPQVAGQVAGLGFKGLYIDANAVSPDTKRGIGALVEQSGAGFVDGGIIGLPPRKRGETWLYLSGPRANEAACCFTAGPIEPEVIGTEVGKASALKMCFAARTKGTRALLYAVLAAAGRLGVLAELKRAWDRSDSGFAQVERAVVQAAPKAWRFGPEMREIAATFESAGVPSEFHQAAAEIYEMLREFKDADALTIEDILRALRAS